VGVPARVAGVPEWADKQGNHTWAEIWDSDWFFTGADEYNKEGLNRAWFNADAARTARSPNPLNQLWATSWRQTGQHFPLAWDPGSRAVPGVNVSARYAALAPETAAAPTLHLRLRALPDGERLAADVELRNASDEVLARDHTRAGTADLNDMPAFTLPEDATNATLRFLRGAEAREAGVRRPAGANSRTLDLVWNELAPVPPALLAAESWLARPPAERGAPPEPAIAASDAPRLLALAWADLRKTRAAAATAELAAKKIVIRDKTLKWFEKSFGDAPAGQRSLWLTLHGGGQATTPENDANWRGYFGRYQFPPGSINVAPRAPADTWNMWFVREVDELFDRLIADMVLARGVDPNRVYLIGYSAGGDGVYQLAPRLADRFAGAAMCAGHPNDTVPDGLRNLLFLLYMGGEDAAYHRNTVVREFSARLDALQAADPQGYAHRLTVYPGLPHNMQGREAEMIPRLAAARRLAWPRRVLWRADNDAAHHRFYWLERAPAPPPAGTVFAARVESQTITIEKPATGKLTLRLSDQLLDLDRPVRVVAGDRTLFEGKVARSFAALLQSLQERPDPETACCATLPVSW
jgi:predicted esterase